MVQTLKVTENYDEAIIAKFEVVKEVIGGIRTIRLQKNIAQKESLSLEVVGENPVAAFDSVIAKLCNLSAITIKPTVLQPSWWERQNMRYL